MFVSGKAPGTVPQRIGQWLKADHKP